MDGAELLELFIILSLVSIGLHASFYMIFEGSPYKIIGKTITAWNKAFAVATLITTGITSIFYFYLIFLEKKELNGKISILCLIIFCVFMGILVAIRLKTFKKE
ncbi:MAG: hypothetical protein CO137_02535 [Candidatus Magasanikbacteria bacterium CG_4_9_14_3_um_filter_32_9]|uniref:Uncharacterized protein n=1 Tax=Candidatus Magasanikbacteria bacterium CG_4_9_14_3_um_filter_32_9 TaxID=1974644 RepID=A0A2M7Z6J9_9BACT|nr:MAG: hypothetical protein CO137_02535 [Candidatus Magasanikbacteria bacterium CG_4_9_14_3_um_filter_32_9]